MLYVAPRQHVALGTILHRCVVCGSIIHFDVSVMGLMVLALWFERCRDMAGWTEHFQVSVDLKPQTILIDLQIVNTLLVFSVFLIAPKESKYLYELILLSFV